ncbi:MAG: hypothetical protein OCD76_11240 [Reichenbachiella sp.]
MIAKVQEYFQTPSAMRYYNFVLIASIGYGLVFMTYSLYTGFETQLTLMYGVLLLVDVICYLMLKKRVTIAYSVFVFVAIHTILYGFFWFLRGGVAGPMTTHFFAMMVVFIVIAPHRLKIPIVIIINVLIYVLNRYCKPIQNVIYDSYDWVWVEYLFNLIAIAISLVYLKYNLDTERMKFGVYNNKIADLALEVESKKGLLELQTQKVQDLKINLEKIIEDSTKELENKNVQLSQYAFDNAHILRAPLSNILGLILLMRTEALTNPELNNKQAMNALNELQEKATVLDEKVGKINDLLR